MFTATFRHIARLSTLWLMLMFSAGAILAQTTTFSYQGRLLDGSTPANGSYDLQFALWDSLSGGTQIGSAQTVNSVSVANGIFAVTLDFGANAFPGASRFLEISARASGGGSFTLLSPRQQITSTPYAVRSLGATAADALSSACVGCVTVGNGGTGLSSSGASGNFLKSNGSVWTSVPLSSADLPSGSGNYIQNSTITQPSSNFNISGNGIVGGRVGIGTTAPADVLHVVGAGTAITASDGSVSTRLFSSSAAGRGYVGTNTANPFVLRTAGVDRVIIGDASGNSLSALGNVRIDGYVALLGPAVLIPYGNVGVGTNVPSHKLEVRDSSNTGLRVDTITTGGNVASFGGYGAFEIDAPGIPGGRFEVTESGNVGIGTTAPQGRLQVVTANDSAPATITAWDARHFVVGAGGRTGGIGMSYDQTNNVGYIEALSPNAFWRNLVLQSGGGNVGIGTAAPADVLHVVGVGTAIRATDGPVATRLFSSNATGKGYVGTTGGAYPFVLRTADADRVTIDATGNVGIGTAMPDLALSVSGNADKSVGGGSWASFSDERLKNIKGRFTPGLKAVMQLQPLRYEYKRDNALGIKSEGVQIGFTAQAVQKLIPEAVTKNDKGYLLINNDPILWTMLNAIKEQQEEIAQKDAEIKALNVRLRAVETVLRKEVGPGLHRR